MPDLKLTVNDRRLLAALKISCEPPAWEPAAKLEDSWAVRYREEAIQRVRDHDRYGKVLSTLQAERDAIERSRDLWQLVATYACSILVGLLLLGVAEWVRRS